MHKKSKFSFTRHLCTRFCALACVLFASVFISVSDVNAVGYTCDDKVYISCNAGYYLSGWGSAPDFKDAAGDSDSCVSCPVGYTCAAGTACPKKNTTSVECAAGKYIAKGATTCSDCPAGYFCEGDTYTIAADGATEAVGATACPAGTYQNQNGQSSCKDCETREKFSSSTGSTSCSSVSNGSFTTGCNSSGNKCTGQTQCTGATYCSGGVQYNCPAQTDGWTRKTGNGWTQVSQCNQTKEATSISSYCSAGQLKQSGNSQGKWNTAEVSVEFEADAGSYVSGTGASTTCAQCKKGYVSAGGNITSCTACGTGKYQDKEGQTSCEDCTYIANSTWEESSGLSDNTCPFTCNDNFTPSGRTCVSCSKTQQCSDGYYGTYNSCAGETQNTPNKCYVDCEAGTYVAEAKKTCTSSVEANSNKYIGKHTVYWGDVSELDSCPDGATGSDANAGSAEGCYKACTEKTIANGTAKPDSGHVYYSLQTKGYTNTQNCTYKVDCDEKYGANTTEATNNPICTLCDKGYYSAGNEGEQCKLCIGMPTGGVAEYTTNATTDTGCLWHCAAGRYKSEGQCLNCPSGTTVPVTSLNNPIDETNPSAGYRNDSIQGCFIAQSWDNTPTEVTDSFGTFVLTESDACPHD